MSIFPKRTIPGKGVTIHWNYNTCHLKGTHIFPFVRIGVKSPDGKVTMLYEGNILALPESKTEVTAEANAPSAYKYLNKNTPLLVLADYLSGRFKKEALIDILSAIQSGRHYYFHYSIPEDAALGKYTLISEVHSNGEIRYSKTAADDHFFVEKLVMREAKRNGNGCTTTVFNPSAEVLPVKIVDCFYDGMGELTTKTKVFTLPANELFTIQSSSSKSFLLYNEEREVLPLGSENQLFPLRNQQYLSLSKKTEKGDIIYVLPKDSTASYQLEGIVRAVWNCADGISIKPEQESLEYQEAYNELLKSGLIGEIDFNR